MAAQLVAIGQPPAHGRDVLQSEEEERKKCCPTFLQNVDKKMSTEEQRL
jgi:hypothetical protein